MRSRPLWARELKHHLMFFLLVILRSRPLWARELKLLVILIRIQTVLGSRPLWARELKLSVILDAANASKSRPLWARELKPVLSIYILFPSRRAPCGRVN